MFRSMIRSVIHSGTRSVIQTAAAVAVCGFCLCLPLRAEAVADDPKQLFDSVFGGRYKDVLRTRETADDLTLAIELIESAATVKDSPAFSVLLYTKAYELAKRDSGGLEIADRSLTNLAAVEGQKAEDIAAKRIELYEEQFRGARDQREAIGNLLVDLYIEYAGALVHGKKIDEAFAVYRKASGIARAVKSPRTADLAELRRQAALHKRIAIKLKSLQSKLDGGDTGAAKEIIQTYLVELDDPTSASEFALVLPNQTLKTIVETAGQPLGQLSDLQALKLAKWYDTQSRSAQLGELSCLARAAAYYKRFFEQHASSDASSFAARVALKQVEKKLEGKIATTTLMAVGPTTTGNPPTTSSKTNTNSTGTDSSRPTTEIAGKMGVKVCDNVLAKYKARNLLDGVTTFAGPDGDGRRGTNGFLFPVDRRAAVLGTRWSGRYKRSGSARALQLVHPFQKGHVVVTLSRDGIQVNPGGTWSGFYGWKGGVSVQKTKDAADAFPLENKEVHVISELAGNGTFQLFLDKKLIASARVVSVKPLTLTAAFKRHGKDPTLTFTPVHAAIIVGPRDRGVNEFKDVHFYPGLGN